MTLRTEPGGRQPRTHVTRADGSGLGLVIVRAVADLHRGSATLESQEGVGSTFTVELQDITGVRSPR